ncbi:MAG: mannose-6-phosphate isomerase, class I [Treponema sp.]|nr:mannose-6-phosphate isomerase, class I [Treponema sp.]
MSGIVKLKNQIQHYEWGSTEKIPRFLGRDNPKGLPWAEMWMGTHEIAPSQVQLETGGYIDLSEYYGEPLSFLFKLIAASTPLSIQAHPNLAQAVEGFNQENAAGLPIDSPKRNYKDSNHKPEVLCAISPFTLMAGFREPMQIENHLEAFLAVAPKLKETLLPLVRAVDSPYPSDSLLKFFSVLFNTSKQDREKICAFITENETCEAFTDDQWNQMRSFAAQYPADAAVISPLYLNLFTLQPGQAIFIPAGVLHAYINGFGAELMSNSDNVLRGGLTPKYVDIPELMEILRFKPFMPEIITPLSSAYFRYPTPSREFVLSFIHNEGEDYKFIEKKPAICLVTKGELKTGKTVFKKGESFFVPKTAEDSTPPVFSGNYSFFAASSV